MHIYMKKQMYTYASTKRIWIVNVNMNAKIIVMNLQEET